MARLRNKNRRSQTRLIRSGATSRLREEDGVNTSPPIQKETCSITPGGRDHPETVYIPVCGTSAERRVYRQETGVRASASDSGTEEEIWHIRRGAQRAGMRQHPTEDSRAATSAPTREGRTRLTHCTSSNSFGARAQWVGAPL